MFHFFTAIQEFGYIGIHTQPFEAVMEIDALYDVYFDMVNRWGIQVINLDCYIRFINAYKSKSG